MKELNLIKTVVVEDNRFLTCLEGDYSYKINQGELYVFVVVVVVYVWMFMLLSLLLRNKQINIYLGKKIVYENSSIGLDERVGFDQSDSSWR